MFQIIGVVVVFAMVFGGFMLAGGHFDVIIKAAPFEMMMIADPRRIDDLAVAMQRRNHGMTRFKSRFLGYRDTLVGTFESLGEQHVRHGEDSHENGGHQQRRDMVLGLAIEDFHGLISS